MKVLVGFGALLLFFIFFYSAHGTAARTPHPALRDSTPQYEMKQYWLTFLYKGSSRSQDSATAERIQAAHLANIGRLAREGKIIMAGPMGYDRDLRGLFIIDAKDSAEAASFIKTDSAIITGRLRFEIHPWWTAKGTYIFK